MLSVWEDISILSRLWKIQLASNNGRQAMRLARCIASFHRFWCIIRLEHLDLGEEAQAWLQVEVLRELNNIRDLAVVPGECVGSSVIALYTWATIYTLLEIKKMHEPLALMTILSTAPYFKKHHFRQHKNGCCDSVCVSIFQVNLW